MERAFLSELAGPFPPSVVAIGNFDGVHRGHQALIAEALRWGRADGLGVTVCTFDPHPLRLLHPTQAPCALTTLDQKAEILQALGVERMVVVAFTPALATTSAEDFVRGAIAARLAARVVVVGPGFRFGAGGRGSAVTLRTLGGALGYSVQEVAAAVVDGRLVSSTRVRTALTAGNVAAARALLGRPFANDGAVVIGEGRGRVLGIPTANVNPLNEMLPADGVYSAWCRRREAGGVWGAAWPAVVNIGQRPTFAGAGRRVEAHLLGFGGDLYGELLRVEYWQRLREERRFADATTLVEQIRQDLEQARASLEAD